MSSEGEFLLPEGKAQRLDPLPIPAFHHFLSPCSQSSRLCFASRLRPATTTTYTTWTRRKACATFSTSPSSTSDPRSLLFGPGEPSGGRAGVPGLLPEPEPEPNIQISYFQGNLGGKKTEEVYFWIHMYYSCLCIGFPVCECVDIQCVCVCVLDISRRGGAHYDNRFLSGKESWQRNRAQLSSPSSCSCATSVRL